jgi:hypothetical protein
MRMIRSPIEQTRWRSSRSTGIRSPDCASSTVQPFSKRKVLRATCENNHTVDQHTCTRTYHACLYNYWRVHHTYHSFIKRSLVPLAYCCCWRSLLSCICAWLRASSRASANHHLLANRQADLLGVGSRALARANGRYVQSTASFIFWGRQAGRHVQSTSGSETCQRPTNTQNAQKFILLWPHFRKKCMRN